MPNLRKKLDIASSTKVKSYTILIKPTKRYKGTGISRGTLEIQLFFHCFHCEKIILIYL